jgi:hypothetical protein
MYARVPAGIHGALDAVSAALDKVQHQLEGGNSTLKQLLGGARELGSELWEDMQVSVWGGWAGGMHVTCTCELMGGVGCARVVVTPGRLLLAAIRQACLSDRPHGTMAGRRSHVSSQRHSMRPH